MGQTLSNIWSYLRKKVSSETPKNNLDNEHTHEQSHYIDIPDVHTHHFSITEPFRVTSTIPHDFTDPVPHVLHGLNNNVHDYIVNKIQNEYFGKEVIPVLPAVVEKQIIVKQEVSKNVPSVSKQPLAKCIGPYTSLQKILLVGEGDFSFSASLAVAFDSASNIIATSLNSQEFLTANYRQFVTNKMKVESRGGTVIHDIDATTMVKNPILGRLKFDRIIYNFPHSGVFVFTDHSGLETHIELIRGFLRNAKKMIRKNGEIHITHKCNAFFLKWNISKLGSDEGLHLIEEVMFHRTNYPGYHTKYGFGGDKDFNCNPSKTYKFGMLSN